MHRIMDIFTKEKTDKVRTITSLEVAEMVEKQHNELLKDIRRYINQLNEGKIPHVDFFEESSYIDEKGQKRPCCNVAKLSCDFLTNKFTGKKTLEQAKI